MAVVCVLGMALVSMATAAEVEIKAVLRPHGHDELERAFWSVSDPDSPEYLRFKSVDELAGIIGAPQSDISEASAWLASLDGFVPGSVRVGPLRDHVSAKFNPSDVDAFGHPSPPAGGAIEYIVRNTPRAANAADTPRRVRAGGGSADAVRMGYDIADQKKAYGIPVDLEASNAATTQMVWGPGTFGYSKTQLAAFKLTQCPKLNMEKVVFDTANHGVPGGDNFGEGNLDVSMIASFGLNVTTIVSNTNVSSSTEEGDGFGAALLDFLLDLPGRKSVPQVLSISLGSLSAASCDLLCSEAIKRGFTASECHAFMQQQRQVCMYLSQSQVGKISAAFQTLGLRGVSVFGSSGDGGSHWSFEPFPGGTPIGAALNKIGCEFQFPVFPTGSPYVTSVGGTTWRNGDSSDPIAWDGSGGGFAWQFPRPPHQDAVVSAYLKSTTGLPPASSFNASGRAYPDVSSVSVEGTSESSPAVAGIFSMIIDHRLNAGLPPLGFIGPRLYKAMVADPNGAFQDVTDGNTKTTCDNGFPAATGWDPVTGWGRPKWDGLLKHFGSDSNRV